MQVDEGLPPIDGGVPVPVEDYAYDEEGNRTASHLSALYTSNAHNQLEEDEAYSYAYDPRGNRVSKTSKATGEVETYAYDSQNRLAGYANATLSASYAYDALDRRIAKTVDGEVTAFVLDQAVMGSLIGFDVALEFEASALKTRWLFGSRVDEQIAFELYAPGVTEAGSGDTYEIFKDHLGSVTTVVSSVSGTISEQNSYDAFGRSDSLNMVQRYRFTGREFDAESGLLHYRQRAYDPITARFVQADPIGFSAGTANFYAYVRNDPFNATDPSGLFRDTGKNVRVGGHVGQWLSLNKRQAAMRAEAFGRVGVGVAGLAAGVSAILGTIEILDLDEGLPDEETPTPEPEPQTEGAGNRGSGPPEGHHCYPTSYGFPKDQELLYLRLSEHQRLHRLMRKHFRNIIDEFGRHMDYGSKWNKTNRDVVNMFGIDSIKDELRKFYDKYPEFGC